MVNNECQCSSWYQPANLSTDFISIFVYTKVSILVKPVFWFEKDYFSFLILTYFTVNESKRC